MTYHQDRQCFVKTQSFYV